MHFFVLCGEFLYAVFTDIRNSGFDRTVDFLRRARFSRGDEGDGFAKTIASRKFG